MDRRGFIKSLFAASAISAAPSWAAVGSPAFLGAAKNSADIFVIAGISETGAITFQTPLPLRGHGFAAHPRKAIAVAFARRPGDVALIINLATGAEIARLDISEFGHFYGHGVFTPDAKFLLTTENDLETSEGRIGIWDAETFERIDSKSTHGIGPHEIINLPKGGYAVANGGILTDPSFERKKLNIATMNPSLAIFDKKLELVSEHRFPENLHQLSIRHLAATRDRIGVGLQWEGDPRDAQPAIAVFENDRLTLREDTVEISKNYIGSVAASRNGALAFSAPRAGYLVILDRGTLKTISQPDIYGIAGTESGFIGTQINDIAFFSQDDQQSKLTTELIWDNHLLKIVKKLP